MSVLSLFTLGAKRSYQFGQTTTGVIARRGSLRPKRCCSNLGTTPRQDQRIPQGVCPDRGWRRSEKSSSINVSPKVCEASSEHPAVSKEPPVSRRRPADWSASALSRELELEASSHLLDPLLQFGAHAVCDLPETSRRFVARSSTKSIQVMAVPRSNDFSPKSIMINSCHSNKFE